MNTERRTPQTNTPARPEWLEALASDHSAASTLRAGAIIHALYPTSARPASRAQARQVKAELIAALDRLHYADLHALNEVVRILASDRDGARWAVRDTIKNRAHYIERIMRHASVRAEKAE